MQQINFTGNLEQAGNTRTFFIHEKVKEIVMEFFTRNRERIVNLFFFFQYNIIIKITQYNRVNVKLSNSQFKKLKSAKRCY